MPEAKNRPFRCFSNVRPEGIGHLRITIFFGIALKIVFYATPSLLCGRKALRPASPEALFDSLWPLQNATGYGNRSQVKIKDFARDPTSPTSPPRKLVVLYTGSGFRFPLAATNSKGPESFTSWAC